MTKGRKINRSFFEVGIGRYLRAFLIFKDLWTLELTKAWFIFIFKLEKVQQENLKKLLGESLKIYLCSDLIWAAFSKVRYQTDTVSTRDIHVR